MGLRITLGELFHQSARRFAGRPFITMAPSGERIRVRGEMVSGAEVEEGALSHPDIIDAAAVAMPARLGEEDVWLFVTLKPGANTSEEDILRHCEKMMAKFMVPVAVTILDEMPRTPTRKPEKGKLALMPLEKSQN